MHKTIIIKKIAIVAATQHKMHNFSDSLLFWPEFCSYWYLLVKFLNDLVAYLSKNYLSHSEVVKFFLVHTCSKETLYFAYLVSCYWIDVTQHLILRSFSSNKNQLTSKKIQATKFKMYKSWYPKAWQLFRAALWLAVELLREPIWGQLKTITNKEPVFGCLRICTS